MAVVITWWSSTFRNVQLGMAKKQQSLGGDSDVAKLRDQLEAAQTGMRFRVVYLGFVSALLVQ